MGTSDKSGPLDRHVIEMSALQLAVPEPTAEPPTRSELERLLGAALARLARGDTDALETVWDLMADSMYGLARWRTGSAAEADDIVQESFVRLVRFGAEAARAERPRGYVLAIVRSVAIDGLAAPATPPARRNAAARAGRRRARSGRSRRGGRRSWSAAWGRSSASQSTCATSLA